MTASIVPLFPDPLGGLDPYQRADAYSDWLLAGAAGLLADTAAAQLLAEHRTWLTRDSFTSRYIELHQAPGGLTVAGIRWRAAVAGLRHQPASLSEKAVLRIAASIGGSVPADLGGCLGTLDTPAIQAVLRAIAHANNGHAGHSLICRRYDDQF